MTEDQRDFEFQITPKDLLLATKEKLGGLEKKEITAETWPEAHRELGQWVGEQVRSIVKKKTEARPDADLRQELEFIRGCERHLDTKREHPLIGQGIQEYLDCLEAWADGAGLDKDATTLSARLGMPVSKTELALWLQNDNVGCQTTMIRNEEGGVSFIHSEEDPEEMVEKPRLATFIIGDRKLRRSSFIYPQLLPGSSFAWGKDSFQAVDALFLKTPDKPGGLANTAAWLLFVHENPYDRSEDMIRSLQPFADGYAINIVRRQQTEKTTVEAKRIVFAQDAMSVKVLSDDKGDVMAFANVMTDEEDENLRTLEKIDPKIRALYERRLGRTERALRLIPHITGQSLGVDALTRIMAFRIGDRFGGKEWSYANTAMKAGITGEMTNDTMRLRIVSGPAMAEDLKAGKFEEVSVAG